jgi:hypothetical protein
MQRKESDMPQSPRKRQSQTPYPCPRVRQSLFSPEVTAAASLEEDEARIAALKRKVGQLTKENDRVNHKRVSRRMRKLGPSSLSDLG